MSNYQQLSSSELQLRNDVQQALKKVKQILSNTRNPCLASPDTPHTYDDKFALSEFLTTTAMMSLCNSLQNLGLDEVTFRRLLGVVLEKKKSLTLRFMAKERCEYVKETVVETTNPHEFVQEETTGGETTKKTVHKVVSKIQQCHWNFSIDYAVYIYAGNDTQGNGEDSTILQNRTISCERITRGTSRKEPPVSCAVREHDPVDASITWLFEHLDPATMTIQYKIDRTCDSCRTPCFNRETLQVKDQMLDLSAWINRVKTFFVNMQEGLRSRNSFGSGGHSAIQEDVSLLNVNSKEIFIPVLPIFETLEKEGDKENNMSSEETTTITTTSPLIQGSDVSAFLAEQTRTIAEQIGILSNRFALAQGGNNNASAQSLITSSEAVIVLLCGHMKSLLQMWSKSIDHIEEMLRSQLYDAIGKTVERKHLDEFVRFHNKRLFSPTYAPEPFCYAIRRPEHYPDGVLSIEEETSDGEDGKVGHAVTFTRKLEKRRIFMPINAATSIEFGGDLYLHAWVQQRFVNKSKFNLAARARQFSSFLLVLGKVSGPDSFEPEHAIILQNKDEVLIPILTEEIPSAKEFKDAIASLSPEQKRFAEAFRSMKLASSVFGVCIIQLKPQLEALLGLPDKSLTKEIRLTQDLLSLFIDYQIPSDLLSFDGAANTEVAEKINVVKGHVKNVMDMIGDAKKAELEEASNRAEMAFETASATMPTVGAGHSDVFGALFGSAAPRRMAKMSRGAQMSQAFSAPIPYASPEPMMKSITMSMSCSSAPAPPIPSSTSTTNNNNNNNNNNNLNQAEGSMTKHPMTETSMDVDSNDFDFTMVPNQLDSQFEKFSHDEMYGGVVRGTTLKTGNLWQKSSKLTLLSPTLKGNLSSSEQKSKRNEAFDLLDALSRSGALPIACAELHIMIASTHCFEKSVVNAVVQDNVNPIEKIERTHLLIASLVHNVPVKELLRDKSELQRIAKYSQALIGGLDDDL